MVAKSKNADAVQQTLETLSGAGSPPESLPAVQPKQGGAVAAASVPLKRIEIEPGEGETLGQAIARARLHPVTRTAIAMTNFNATVKNDIPIGDVIHEVSKHVAALSEGMARPEAMLLCQALTLDTMFNELANQAGANMLVGRKDATEQYLRMALKAQAQCRTTLETLAEIRNPRQATFVKQQNVAHQQQVNNGVLAPDDHARAREKEVDERSNKLLEGHNGERLDTGTAGAPSSVDSHLGALGKVDGPPKRGGQKAGK